MNLTAWATKKVSQEVCMTLLYSKASFILPEMKSYVTL